MPDARFQQEVQLVSLEGQTQSSAGLRWVTEHPGCKTGGLLDWTRLRGFAGVMYLSHSSGCLWDFWSPTLSPLKDIICCRNGDINSDGRSWWYWRTQNKVTYACDLASLNCSESLTCSLSLERRLVRGEGGKPDTFGSCHNFFVGIRAIFSAIKLLIQ